MWPVSLNGQIAIRKDLNMKKKLAIALAAVAVVGLPIAVIAATKTVGMHHSAMASKMMENHDLDKDGKVTREEMLKSREEMFDLLDADKDGAVTKEEARALHDKMRERAITKRMMKYDTNSDGFLSKEEYAARYEKKFKKMDTDGDGRISATELAKAKQDRHHKRHSGDDKKG
ncbi:MAG: Ca2+-binding EF-hand superfamily protein [Sneathiella sp.]